MKIWEFEARSFGDTLRELREDKNLTQMELGKKCCGIAQSTIKNYENAKVLPTLRSLIEIAHVLGIDEVRIDTSKGGYFTKWN